MENKPVSGADRLSDVKRTLDVAKQSFALELARQRERFTKEFDLKNKEIRDLKLQLDATNADWESKLKDKGREITTQLSNICSLENLIQQLQKLLKDKESKTDELVKELTDRKTDFEKQLNEKNILLEASHTRIRTIEEDLSLARSRLQEEQNKWEEILQMKEKDFNTFKKEVEKKRKEWEQEYMKEEEDFHNIRRGKLQLEKELEELADNMKQMELRYKDRLFAKDTEIMTLKNMLESNERSWQKRLGDLEIENWEKDIDTLVKFSSSNLLISDEKETMDKDKEKK